MRAPVLLLIGAHDRVIRTDPESFRRVIREVTIEMIPGPHLLLQANPGDAWEAIARFLQPTSIG
jgi:surfactin synthase thioesterase subunit